MWQGKKTYLAGGAAVLLVVAAAGAWLGRGPLLAWYYLRGLAGAGEGDRPEWARRVAGLDGAAVPPLLDCLGKEDDRACANARAALDALARRWPPGDPRGDDLARRLAEGFGRFSAAGRREALGFAADWVAAEGGSAGAVPRLVAQALPEAGRSADPDVRAGALDLASALLERPDHAEALGPCRELALAGFADAGADNRARAARLALAPGMDLQQQALPLLRDAAPAVRRVAMLVVGPAQNVVSTDELLRWLHDPDPEVRRLCEVALATRQVPKEHVCLGRLLTDADHHERLKLLDPGNLPSARDIDVGVWLRYLSNDPLPSVRIAALRAPSDVRFATPVDFRDRLEQMAKSDPEPSVRWEASFYLSLTKE